MNKKLLSLFLACALPIALLAGSGDANSDEKVDVADIVEIVNYLKGTPSDNFDFDKADISGTAPTETLPLWKQDVDSGSAYSESTNKFTKVVVPGVRTVSTEPTAPTEVFETVSHDNAYGSD